MNNLHLLHFLVEGKDRELPWRLDLTARHVVLLRARTLSEAASLSRACPLMMILADLAGWDSQAQEAITQLGALTANSRRIPAIGLLRFEPDAAQRDALSSSGLDGLVSEGDPERFVRWPIELLTRLNELSDFEQSRMEVGELANQTRQRLHDLSQPLSAIQGRLQLLAAKCPEDDPNAASFNEMVRLIFDVSRQVMEIQRLHRNYS